MKNNETGFGQAGKRRLPLFGNAKRPAGIKIRHSPVRGNADCADVTEGCEDCEQSGNQW
ncbi:hypothetical protein HSX37_11410|uniref:hypothetical protein n=1 Tax=Dendrosporobacter quercicolus TaxID=146817 RepID=UPI00156D40E2|nr:hypothetical protein [Dendrosporobacter quercicolus]NSL48641.1 hypothetical protein [Dendrosporobacter quercicolus DSM 1736]